METTKQGEGNVSRDVANNEEQKVEQSIPKSAMKKIDISEEEAKKVAGLYKKEFEFATAELDSWIDINLKRLKLYNNQKRGEQFVGEPLLYSHMDTWMSALYQDQMDQNFAPRESGDIEQAENLNELSRYDYDLMGMQDIVRDQDWDALFFSYSVTDVLEFDYKMKCPAPYVLDPMTFYYDTLASTINGNVSGKGGMRYLGWSVFMSVEEIRNHPLLGEEALEKIKQNWSKDKDEMGRKERNARKERILAMGGAYEELGEDMGDNTVFELIQWRSKYDRERHACIMTPDMDEILGMCKLPQDDRGSKKTWWVVAKKYSPMPHQFKGVSLTDLLEDKQRKKAELVNDMLKLGRATVFGSYAFDSTKIENVTDLAFGYDKWIPVTGDPNSAIAPIRKDIPMTGLLDGLLMYIDSSAQKASATSELSQGVLSSSDKTASEINIVAQMSQARYGLVAKSFAKGDKEFWEHWYLSYKLNFKEGLGAKMVRIGGSGSKQYREMNRKDIICNTDPDVFVESLELSRAKRTRTFSMAQEPIGLLINDPQADKRASIKFLLYLSGLERSTVDTLLPPTQDELIAMEQNKQINSGKMPEMLQNDNHLVHIRVHKEAIENDIKKNHIEAHYQALRLIQVNPNLAPAQQTGMQTGEVAPAGAGANMQNGVPANPNPIVTPSKEANISNTR